MNDRKQSETTFIPRLTTILWRRRFFPNRKIAILPIEVFEESGEFRFGDKKPIFSGMRRLPFMSDAFQEIVTFLYLFIYLFYFVYFIFIILVIY